MRRTRLLVLALLAALVAAVPASARLLMPALLAALIADTVVALPRLAYPRGFALRVHGVRVARRAPLTLRGSGRSSITVTRR